MPNSDGSSTPAKPYPVMASGAVHHVGDIVAMVVADSEWQARDAAEAIPIDWDTLSAVVDVEAADPGWRASGLRRRRGEHRFLTRTSVTKRGPTPSSKKAARVARVKVTNQRVVANYMEPRCAVAEYDVLRRSLDPACGQSGRPLHAKDHCPRHPENTAGKLRVVTNDVGGGFGTKAFVYREYPLLLEVAKRLGRSVIWRADRTEHFVGDTQGRDNVTHAEMALDEEGRFLALRVDILANLGGYLSQFGPYVPWLGASMATGPLTTLERSTRAYEASIRTPCRSTRTVARGALRRPMCLERLVDRCARVLGSAPAEIRARNLVKASQMPYRTQTNRHIRRRRFRRNPARVPGQGPDYPDFENRAEEATSRGVIRGIGISSYLECTAWDGDETGRSSSKSPATSPS